MCVCVWGLQKLESGRGRVFSGWRISSPLRSIRGDWTAPGGSVALPERSGEFAGGFGGSPVRFWEVQESPGGVVIVGVVFQVP